VRSLPTSIDDALRLVGEADYVADRSLATVLFLALKMGRPLFLEGEAGVGKTEIAKVLAKALGPQAHPPAMLRGARRFLGGLRVELRRSR
jgi:MoxR-like ATPase